MIQIRPIKPEEIPAAKHVILSVAYRIYGWSGTFEESVHHFEATGEFADMDSVQEHYFSNNGYFLAVLDDETVVGSGAIRKLDVETAELKRMWLLEQYHGQGLGLRVIRQLLDFARKQGYARVRLQTGSQQARAIGFYRKVGFREIPSYNDDENEISMEISLAGTNPLIDSSSTQQKETP
jgi:putative acetyltransferase